MQGNWSCGLCVKGGLRGLSDVPSCCKVTTNAPSLRVFRVFMVTRVNGFCFNSFNFLKQEVGQGSKALLI